MKRWWYHKNTVGILGTIIVHLIIVIIFMSIKLSVEFRNFDQAILIDLSNIEALLQEKAPEPGFPENESSPEMEKFRDIAVNVSDIPDAPFDVEAYMEQIKNELIEAGDIGKDNYLDMMRERARLQEEAERNMEFIDNDPLKNELEETKASPEMASDYQGPTRIYYNLPNRIHIKLSLPVYKCPEAGKVTLKISVNQYGTVVAAEVLEEESSTDDHCLYNAARSAALSSRFNSGQTFPVRQKGTITYLFTAQTP